MGQSASQGNPPTSEFDTVAYQRRLSELLANFASCKRVFYIITSFLYIKDQIMLSRVSKKHYEWQMSRKDILIYEYDCSLTTRLNREVLERLIDYTDLGENQVASIIKAKEWNDFKNSLATVGPLTSGSTESRIPVPGTFIGGLAVNRADLHMEHIDGAKLHSLAIIMPQADPTKNPLPRGWDIVSFDSGIFATPFTELRHLVLDHVVIIQPFSSLRSRSPLLEDLQVTFCEVQNDPEFGIDFVNFQSLRALRMSFKDYHLDVLGPLNLPMQLKLLRIFISNSCAMTIFATHCIDLRIV